MSEINGNPVLRVASWFALVVAVAATLGVYLEMAMVQGLKPGFDDFDAEMPALTAWVVSVPPWLIGVGAVTLLVLLVVKEVLLAEVVARLAINLCVTAGLLVASHWVWLAIRLPAMGADSFGLQE